MKKTIKDIELKNKRVIIRCDLNVPMDGNEILDDTRIKESLKSINYLIDNNCKVIILSHLGKVKTEEDKKKNSLFSVSKRLGELLGKKVYFSPETRGPILESLVKDLEPKEVLLVENTRYEDVDGKKESNCDLELAKYWASFGDVFINDAYGTCHRKHASNVGIASFLPSAIGFLVKKEVNNISEFINEETHPFIALMGGKKIVDKIPIIRNLITKCDYLLIGGGMSYTFLKALGYDVGNSIMDDDNISFCTEMLEKYKDKIILPIDFIVSKDINSEDTVVRQLGEIKKDESSFDIGPKTINKFCDFLKSAKRVIINGPVGVFELDRYAVGTKSIYSCLRDYEIKTLIGGGDSASSVNNLGFKDSFYHISTGGGATLEFLSGNVLPGIDAIDDK